MKTAFRLALGCALVLVLATVAAVWLGGAPHFAGGGLSLDINGQPWRLSDLNGWHWALAGGGGLFAALLLLLAVAWGVLAALAGLALLLLGVALVLLLALSPLWLVVLLVWLLLRRKPTPADTIRA